MCLCFFLTFSNEITASWFAPNSRIIKLFRDNVSDWERNRSVPKEPTGRADRWSLLGKDVYSLGCPCQYLYPSGGGFPRVLRTPVGELHWLKCMNIQEISFCASTRVRLIVLHPTVLLDESVNHLLHGQIGNQLILGQRAAGYWVEMTNALWRESQNIKRHIMYNRRESKLFKYYRHIHFFVYL